MKLKRWLSGASSVDSAAGKSPRAIAKALNAEGIPGPDERQWRDTTSRGQIKRGTGILNNALYAGQLEWNRCSLHQGSKDREASGSTQPQGPLGDR